MKREYLIGGIIIAVIIGTLAISFISLQKITENSTQGRYDDFATCLTDKGAVLHGTDTCAHCKEQERMFGNSFRNLNFVDCNDNTKVCLAAGVRIYPTWTINGSIYEGAKTPERLADITGCEINAVTLQLKSH